VVADFPLVFLDYGGLLFACYLSFLSFWQDCSSQDVFFEGVAEPTCRRRGDFWPFFFVFPSLFFLILKARSTLICGAREGHAPPFSGRARRQPVIRRRISVCVVSVTASVLHASLSGILAFSPHYRQLVLGVFCLCVFCVFILFLQSQPVCV
jgi:hypothetical protein